jgi:hypothetical protein
LKNDLPLLSQQRHAIFNRNQRHFFARKLGEKNEANTALQTHEGRQTSTFGGSFGMETTL